MLPVQLTLFVALPSIKEHREVSCAVNDRDHLNWLGLPSIGDHIGIEVPEAVSATKQFLVVVADSG